MDPDDNQVTDNPNAGGVAGDSNMQAPGQMGQDTGQPQVPPEPVPPQPLSTPEPEKPLPTPDAGGESELPPPPPVNQPADNPQQVPTEPDDPSIV